MFPKMNERQIQQAMRKMGLKQEEVDAIAVIIRTKKEDIIIRNPSVQRVNMMGHLSYQVSGDEERRPVEEEIEISEEDLVTVQSQTGASKEDALASIKKNKGDLAAAILSLKKE